DAAELLLQDPVGAPDLLLLAQLQGVPREPRLLLPVLAGRVAASLDRALVGEAFLAFEKQLLAFAPALAAPCVQISCHVVLLLTRGAAWAGGSRYAESGSRPKWS